MEGFRYDAHPMGMLIGTVGALSTFYPDAKNVMRPRVAAPADAPADRQDADASPRSPTATAAACRTSTPTTSSPTPATSSHAVQDDGAPATSRTRCSSARSTSCSSCTPTTSRTARRTRCARSAARTPIRTRRSPRRPPRSTARGTAAPTRTSSTCCRRSARSTKIPELIKQVKAGERRLMGFGHRVYKNYDPRAKIIKQLAHEVFEVTGQEPAHRHRPRARAHRARGRLLRQAPALSERRLLLGHHLPGDGLPGDDVPGAVRHPPHRRAGWRSGRSWSSTRSRASRARSRSTRATTSAPTCRSSSGATAGRWETEVRGPL